MGLDNLARASLPTERRAADRARTHCPAQLQTPVRKWEGRMWDLSETGARVQVVDPPPQGATVLVTWHSSEVFSRVMWSTDDMCGLQFERPISRSVVLQTLGEPLSEPESGPAASVRNIPIGKRRSRLRSADDE